MQQLICGPDRRGDGQQPHHSRAQPQCQRRRTQHPHPQSSPIEEKHLLAGVGGDENRRLDPTSDLVGQDAVGRFVVVEPERQFGQAVQA